jgi:formylmethanofuran dehydrogenase subunit E
MTTQHIPPEWAFEFHGHECPFMPIGFRMGKLAQAYLGVENEADHGFFIFPELGEGHPQTCMIDGLQIATDHQEIIHCGYQHILRSWSAVARS